MTGSVVQFGVGSRLVYDGEHAEVIEVLDRDVLLRMGPATVRRVPLVTILNGQSAGVRLLSADGEEVRADTGDDPVAEVLGQLDEQQRAVVRERAAHVREVLTGYRSGSSDLAVAGEPRDGYGAGTTLTARYAAKSAELGVAEVSVRRWCPQVGSCLSVLGRGRPGRWTWRRTERTVGRRRRALVGGVPGGSGRAGGGLDPNQVDDLACGRCSGGT